ncbi:MAG: hypothetical protein H7Y38_04915 [Armatimonadetes bacterium]|nr:hypothetical protein [Armatimonadota bacterium]
MSLVLELSPTQESELQNAAYREGIPVPDYAQRLLLAALRLRLPVDNSRRAALESDAARAFAASGMSEDELDEYAVRITKQVRVAARDADDAGE